MGEIVYEAPLPSYAAFLKFTQGELNATGWPLNSTSLALENSRVIKSGAGTLYGIGGMSNKASSQFVQVFDATTVPADGAIPVLVFPVGATSAISLFFGDVGRFFQQGIVVCNSSTAATKTIGAADCWFDCQYI